MPDNEQAIELTVELRPMKYDRETVIGPVTVPLNQSEVIVNDARVGFICDHDGAPLNFIEPLPEDVKQLIVDEVTSLRDGLAVGASSEPPSDDAVERALEERARAAADEDPDDEELDEPFPTFD